MKESFRKALTAPVGERGFGLTPEASWRATATVELRGKARAMQPRRGGDRRHHQLHQHQQPLGDDRRRAAGQKGGRARARGPPYVKTSLAPGSQGGDRVSGEAGPERVPRSLGFHSVGYGCTTCIGNSGPLPEPVSQRRSTQGDLVAAAVLSGNRNFEGRINPDVKANYLASPPLVVAYALAGTTDIDLVNEPLGMGSDGKPVI